MFFTLTPLGSASISGNSIRLHTFTRLKSASYTGFSCMNTSTFCRSCGSTLIYAGSGGVSETLDPTCQAVQGHSKQILADLHKQRLFQGHCVAGQSLVALQVKLCASQLMKHRLGRELLSKVQLASAIAVNRMMPAAWPNDANMTNTSCAGHFS